jgi:AraC-like DNA-binding protein
MAAICRISLRQLERLFAEAFHQTPKIWLRDFRCRLAVGLLAQGHSNKEVVAELCFGSSSHFCHDFRKAYAGTPRKTAERLFRCRNVANRQQTSLLSNTSALPPKDF